MRRALVVIAVTGCASAPQPRPPAPPDHHATHDHATHDHATHDHATHADHRGGMHHRFDDAEEWAKVFDDPARDAWQQPDRVIAALALAPEMTVVDVGAGTGYFTMRLARAVPKGTVIATDVEADMVRYLTERAGREGVANVRAVKTPPGDPQLGTATVDRILVVDVWHHLSDRAAYAKHLAAALRPGGTVTVVDFKLDATRGPPAQHRLAPDAILADLRAAGLTAEVAGVDLPDQYLVVGRR